jgi:anti-sigma regulatory factor (Ser/Thr protein kinase)
MSSANPYTVTLKFPGDLEHIPSIRKFVSELLQVNAFDSKFAYRSEIIVDEICNNAVTHGSTSAGAQVTLIFRIFADKLELEVQDMGGERQDIENLRSAVAREEAGAGLPLTELKAGRPAQSAMGLEIVRMLSEQISLNIDANNVTSVRVVRRREETEETNGH